MSAGELWDRGPSDADGSDRGLKCELELERERVRPHQVRAGFFMLKQLTAGAPVPGPEETKATDL